MEKPERKFVPGFIFGSAAQRHVKTGENAAASRRTHAHALRMFRHKDRNDPVKGDLKHEWMVYHTPLSRYAKPLLMNFKKYLKSLAKKKISEGGVLRVLDVGAGDARQWLPLPKGVELHATTLARHDIQPELQGRVKVVNASGLHRHFPAEYFDLIVTHKGMHKEELEGIENAIHLLKPGGNAILVFSGKVDGLPAPRFYRILKTAGPWHLGPGFFGSDHAVHIRKNAPNQPHAFGLGGRMFWR